MLSRLNRQFVLLNPIPIEKQRLNNTYINLLICFYTDK